MTQPRFRSPTNLPHTWAENPEQRKKAKIPAEITFQTKPQIALAQIKTAKAEGVAPGAVLADAGYGADGGFRVPVYSSKATADAIRYDTYGANAVSQADAPDITPRDFVVPGITFDGDTTLQIDGLTIWERTTMASRMSMTSAAIHSNPRIAHP